MKCSEYLWKYVELQNLLKGESPERIQGEMRLALGSEKIVSDTTGEEMTEREARAVLGRNERQLRKAYADGLKGVFMRICEGQQISDDEYQKAKEEAEKAEAEGDGEATKPETPAEGETETETPAEETPVQG